MARTYTTRMLSYGKLGDLGIEAIHHEHDGLELQIPVEDGPILSDKAQELITCFGDSDQEYISITMTEAFIDKVVTMHLKNALK